MNAMKRILAFFLTACLAAVPVCVIPAQADSTGATEMDSTNVLEDLSGAEIGGKAFDAADYPPDAAKDADVLLFAEYCYSSYSNQQKNYSLYVYVWNPRQLEFDLRSVRNTIQISAGSTTDYVKYPLQYLNRSGDGLYYKFKIILTEEGKETLLGRLDKTERFYHISGIELLTLGSLGPKDYEVNAEYRYTGYAEGYGPKEGGALSYTKCRGEVALIGREDIGQTYYRPDGHNGKNNYTQDSLSTVYFAVPNKLKEKYGNLTSVRAEWLRATTGWGLVTGNQEAYDFFQKLVGVDTTKYGGAPSPTYRYGLMSANVSDTKFVYNYPGGSQIKYDKKVPWLAYLFNAGKGDNAADTYRVSTETLLKWMADYHGDYDDYTVQYKNLWDRKPEPGELLPNTRCETPYGGELLTAGGTDYGYSKALFESWDKQKTVADIDAEAEYSLTEEKIDQNWWESLWGDYHTVSSKRFDGIEAIHEVEAQDFKATAMETCRDLYIAEADYTDFKDFYTKATKTDKTVYLLRFDVGEYSAVEVGQGSWDLDGPVTGIDGDTNAYLFQETVYLGFDIIQLGFDNGTEQFVIAAVSDPIDVVSGTTPPLITTDDTDWKQLLYLLGFIVLLIVLWPLWWLLIKFVVWLVTLPFKALAQRIKNKRE